MSEIDPLGDLPGQRLFGRKKAEPFTGVPGHLRPHIREQLTELLVMFHGPHLDLLALRLHVQYRSGGYAYDDVIGLVQRIEQSDQDGSNLLDLIQASLRLEAEFRLPDERPFAEEIAAILLAGGSAYTISPDGLSIVMRNDPTAESAARQAVSASDAAADDIAEAWHEAFGLEPDPRLAWNAAIRAVEHLLIAVLWPDEAKRGKQTLSSALARLRDNPTKWRFEHPKIELDTLVAMLRSLAYEPGRHGADTSPAASIVEAAAEVQLAVTLVSWLRAGLLRPAKSS